MLENLISYYIWHIDCPFIYFYFFVRTLYSVLENICITGIYALLFVRFYTKFPTELDYISYRPFNI